MEASERRPIAALGARSDSGVNNCATCGHQKGSHMTGTETYCLRCECTEFREERPMPEEPNMARLVVHMATSAGATLLRLEDGTLIEGVRTVDVKDAHPTLTGMKRLVTVTIVDPEVRVYTPEQPNKGRNPSDG